MTLLATSRRTYAAVAVLVTSLTGAMLIAGPTAGSASPAKAAAAKPSTTAAAKPTKAALVHPSKKYYGVSVAGAPGTLSGVVPSKSGVANVTTETGKQPNLLMFYEAWNGNASSGTPNLDVNGINNACNAGLEPMLTWESWNTSARISTNSGAAYTQPLFKMSRIVAGDYDTYIKKTAQDVAALNCPIMLRFDQEQNGYWYPWGLDNTTENGTNTTATGAEYIKMWDHVWNIFNAAGANKNTIWTWSPNWQPTVHPRLPVMQASWPGASKVDLIAIDSYYSATGDTFAKIFNPTISQIDAFASSVPRIVGETGVGDFRDKPAMISDLLTSVLRRPRFIGVVYFDQHKSTDRSYWPFQETTASQKAFNAGINVSGYAAGKAGSL
jgi:hypothetical protein